VTSNAWQIVALSLGPQKMKWDIFPSSFSSEISAGRLCGQKNPLPNYQESLIFMAQIPVSWLEKNMGLRRHHRFMWSFSKSLALSLKRPVFVYLTTISFTVMGLSSLTFYLIERTANPKITNWFDAFYFTVTVMTGVGLGDIVPMTVLGRLLAIAMMLIGTAIFVCFTAALGASILQIELEHTER
jgi:hypothetical protein